MAFQAFLYSVFADVCFLSISLCLAKAAGAGNLPAQCGPPFGERSDPLETGRFLLGNRMGQMTSGAEEEA